MYLNLTYLIQTLSLNTKEIKSKQKYVYIVHSVINKCSDTLNITFLRRYLKIY